MENPVVKKWQDYHWNRRIAKSSGKKEADYH
jgi:hypothetical protein